MSHKRFIAVLAHHQPLGSHSGTTLPEDVADLLVQRMVAERISRKVIRMLPPNSVFSAAKLCPTISNYIPERLPPQEIENCKFRLPISAAASTVPRTHYLSRRREIFGDWQLTTSLLPAHQSA